MTQAPPANTKPASRAPAPPLFSGPERSNWVRLRTLIALRWIAIAGQLITVTVAQHLFALYLPLGWIFIVIGASTVSNLVAGFVFPESRRLSEGEMVAVLLFDIAQLGVLLFLTGGLNNPFALLILAPVTISAAALKPAATLLTGALAVLIVTLVSRWHLPLVTVNGDVMRMPSEFLLGFFVALVIGTGFLALYARRVTSELTNMADALTATQMALAREQKLTDLGGVVAAAAHELGTPLATITLVSGELMDELTGEQAEDARLIREQAERCRVILRSMGQAGKDDLHLRHAPFSSIVEEAAAPHQNRGKVLNWDIAPRGEAAGAQPIVQRRPEIIHGIRNLVQNAVDFAAAQVWIDIRWTETSLLLRISDDGQGYPPHVLPRLGDPFLRQRREPGGDPARPGYEGMGLGLFIAKTLLERSGAELDFANGRDPFEARSAKRARRGAVVEAVWPRSAIEVPASVSRGALGQNRPISPT